MFQATGIDFLERIPLGATFEVGGADFPVFFRFARAGEQALALFFLGEVEEELEDADAVTVEIVLEADDVAVAVAPEVFVSGVLVRKHLRGQDGRHGFGDEDLFIVGAIEDADMATYGQAFGGAPEKVMGEFLPAGLFEAVDHTALGVDAAHDVADGPVFAGGIHALKNQQQRITSVGVKHPLALVQLFAEFLHQTAVVFLRPVERIDGGGNLVQPHFVSGADGEILRITVQFHEK